jgi:hypothetical protein
MVPGAAGNQVAASGLQLQRRANDINDVNGTSHALFQVEVRGIGQTTNSMETRPLYRKRP